MIKQQRREFLKWTGSLAMGAALTPLAGKWIMDEEAAARIKTFGLQLWTVRDELAKDPKATLKQVASSGYKHVESFEGAKGLFWGMKNTEFKKYITDLGMTMHSSHFGGDDGFEKKVADAAEIGMKYLTRAWEGPGKTIDDYKKFAEEFNKKGELCKKNGLRFAFHNHDFTFRQLEGQLAQDVLINGTDSSLVDFEMDIYWVVAAGQDPEAWFKKYPNRFRLCHIKDMNKTPGTDNGKNSVTLGSGSINFKKVLKTAKDNGMNYFIVEQEYFEGSTPLKDIEADAGYMKKLKI
jgi:sugar phosphate isomerase/epimerase